MKYKKVSLYVVTSILFNNMAINSLSANYEYSNESDEGQFEVNTYEKVPIDDLILELNKNIENYEKQKDINYLELAIINFGNLPKRAVHIENNDTLIFEKINYIFTKIKIYCYGLNTNALRETYVKSLAENIFLGWKYNKEIVYYKDVFLLEEIVKYNKNVLPTIQDRLDYLKYLTEVFEISGDPYPFDEIIPEITIPDETDPDKNYDDFDKDSVVEDFENTGNNNVPSTPELDNEPSVDGFIQSGSNDSDLSNSQSFIHTVSKYEKKGDKCYKIEEVYSGGQLSNTKKTLVNKSEYFKCGIYDYFNFGSSEITPSIEIDTEYLYENQNEDSSLYLYYTVTKNSKNPYYFNSGIRLDKYTKSLTYNQAVDVLYQIALKEDTSFVKDNDKALFIIQGKPIVLDSNSSSTYSELYLNNILSECPNLGVKVMDEDTYDESIEEYDISIDKDYISTILINNTELVEDNLAWVENDSIKAYINTLAIGLDASVTKLKNSLVITKDNNKIELFNNKKECYIDGVKVELDSETYIIDGNYVIDLKLITDTLGYIMDYDIEKNTLIISNQTAKKEEA